MIAQNDGVARRVIAQIRVTSKSFYFYLVLGSIWSFIVFMINPMTKTDKLLLWSPIFIVPILFYFMTTRTDKPRSSSRTIPEVIVMFIIFFVFSVFGGLALGVVGYFGKVIIAWFH